MTDRIEDGGPAFPHLNWNSSAIKPSMYSGVSLRDWFAGQALVIAWDARDKGYFEGDDHDMAATAYQVADAMLSARQKGGDA
jgi:hypothetical protein